MIYILKEVVLRTNNSPKGMEKISQLWEDILSKKISLLPENKNEFLISKYSNYESDENGEYDLTIMRRELNFLLQLDERAKNREFIKYEEIADDIESCARKVWARVWEDKKIIIWIGHTKRIINWISYQCFHKMGNITLSFI